MQVSLWVLHTFFLPLTFALPFPNITINNAIDILHEAVGIVPCSEEVNALKGLLHLAVRRNKFNDLARIQVMGWMEPEDAQTFDNYLLPVLVEMNTRLNYLKDSMVKVLKISKVDEFYEEFKYSLRGEEDSQIAYSYTHFVDRFGQFSRNRNFASDVRRNFAKLQKKFPTFDTIVEVQKIVEAFPGSRLSAETNVLRESNKNELVQLSLRSSTIN